MSIATELSNLNDNILDAYTAVDGKGGTVPENKNTDNLATAITSIPSGGGATEIHVEVEGPQGEGHITAYDTTTGVITGDGFGSTVGKVWFLERDTHTYKALPTSSWSDTSITLTTPIDATSFEGYTSIGVEDADGFWTTKLMVYGNSIIATHGYVYFRNSIGTIEKLAVDDNFVYNLGGQYPLTVTYTLSGKTFTNDDIVGLMLNPSGSFSSTTYRLCYLRNLNQPIIIPQALNGGHLFTGNTNFNQPIIINAVNLSTYIMLDCVKFNQEISLPNCTQYGNYFMQNCANYKQNFTIGTIVTSVGTNFLNSTGCKKVNILGTPSFGANFLTNCSLCEEVNVGSASSPSSGNSLAFPVSFNNIPAYINGVTIKGTNRSAWLTALPNSDTSPYRKLIDGGE